MFRSLRAQASYATTLRRLMTGGVEMPATIVSFTPGQSIGTGRNVHLEIEVSPPGGTPYSASLDQLLPPTIVSSLATGQRVTVKVAPDAPQTVMLWNTPHAAGGVDPDTGRAVAPASVSADDARIARLEKLQAMRSSGELSEAEFQTLKAKVLASPDAPGA